MKRCSRCRQEFPRSAEYFHRKGRYLHCTCKPCTNEVAREYQKARYVPRVRDVPQDLPRQSFDASTLASVLGYKT